MAIPVETFVDDQKTPLLPVIDPTERPSSSEEQSCRECFKAFVMTPKTFFIFLGPLMCAVICTCVKMDGPDSSRNMLGVMAWIFEWWMTQAVPMPVTSMAPLFLFPLFGIASADDVAHSFMDDVIALVLGSFILALAVEHYNIHRRLALNVSQSFLFHFFLCLNFSFVLL